MKKKITIAVDAMGGENAPFKTIGGINEFIKRNKSLDDFLIKIYGDVEKIKSELDKYNIEQKFFQIIHSEGVVSDNETPLTAIKNSKNTSMWNCVSSQLDAESDISLSAGNTGVLLVISKMILKTIKNVNKPALAGLWPNEKGMNIVLDLGANIECDENNLIQFSEMGAALYKSLYNNDHPKVALLNIGSEEIKGTELLKKTYSTLKKLNSKDFNFNGFIEGNEIMKGDSNVIITDGFTGNIALKTAEGTAKFITTNLKNSLNETIFSKISLLFSFKSLQKFKERLDPRKFNGAIFLGLNGPVVKSHGSIDYIGFYYSIDLCYKIVKGNLMRQIKYNLSHLNEK